MHSSHAGRRSRAQLTEWRDAWRGRTCAILGNGPSLATLKLERLASTPAFCLNRGYLKWRESKLEPEFFIAINKLVIDQFRADIRALHCRKFIPWIYREGFEDDPDAVFFELRPFETFIGDARRGVAPGATVTIAALQIAFHLGFTTVILLGIDHRFQDLGPPHAEVVQSGADLNHFRPDYFEANTVWNLPDLVASERGYEAVDAAYARAGRRIFNATPGTALNVFERSELDELLA